jgi:hypothetical protein
MRNRLLILVAALPSFATFVSRPLNAAVQTIPGALCHEEVIDDGFHSPYPEQHCPIFAGDTLPGGVAGAWLDFGMTEDLFERNLGVVLRKTSWTGSVYMDFAEQAYGGEVNDSIWVYGVNVRTLPSVWDYYSIIFQHFVSVPCQGTIWGVTAVSVQ